MKKIEVAVILGAGFGKRLTPITNEIPKPLVEIGNETILEKTIKLIKKLNQLKKRFKNIFLRLSKAIKLSNDVFVHRDFHVSNIMLKQKKFHLIDSQDAVIGNSAYDLASLIDDVRLKTSNSLKEEMFNHFTKKYLNRDLKKFENDFLILSVLRNFKILGIFSRLAKRDDKTIYLKYIPYTWSLIKLRTKNGKVFDELRFILNNNKFI